MLLIALFAGIMLAGTLTVTWRRVVRAGRETSPVRGDAVVVFGAQALPDRPSPELEARLRHAAALYHRDCARTIVCSGGRDGAVSEPGIMGAALVRLGIPARDIVLDHGGNSTRQTVASAKRLAAGHWQRVILVSSAYHVYRIVGEARRQGLLHACSPARATPIMIGRRARWQQTLREVAAVWWYALSACALRLAATFRVRLPSRDQPRERPAEPRAVADHSR